MLSTIQNGSSVSNQQFVGIDLNLIGSLFSDFENQVFESSGDVEALDPTIPTLEGSSWHLFG